jgi:tRNA-binding EMAP/Myf-like protein
MPVKAMQVTSKTAHEKTDQLFIYTFESPAQGELTIVANLTNVYEPGDVVGVALIGTMLAEGEIKHRKVFGIPSSGMALGKVNVPLDTDLTELFKADHPARPHKVLIEVLVDGHYESDAEAAARKAIGKGEGRVVSVAPIET